MSQENVNYRSYRAMLELVQTSASSFREFDVIVGVPRSGIVPAACLANMLGIPFATLDAAISDTVPYSGFRSQKEFTGWATSKLLVIDDSVNNGNEISRVREQLGRRRLNATYLAVYASTKGREHVDRYLEIVEYPRLFEWNILNHPLASHSCYDLDGVLCRDPTDSEKADEDSYRRFILGATPLNIPQYQIGWIVTSRLERYREETEHWLLANRVKYRELLMMRHVDADTRQRFLLHALYKAEIFKRLDASYFVESTSFQSRVIARLSQKPCFSTENMVMYYGYPDNPQAEPVDRLTVGQVETEILAKNIPAKRQISNRLRRFFCR